MTDTAGPTVRLRPSQWQAWLDSLYELNDRLERRGQEDGPLPQDATPVDAYALSAHAEALLSAEVDGGLWETYRDLELEGAEEDAQAWADICAFYLDRGCVLVQVPPSEPEDEAEEWILALSLARRLQLPGLDTPAE